MDESDSLYARTAMYELLARLYTYPLDSAALDAVTALRLENAPTALSDALAVMQARIAAAPDRAALVEALNVEATRLFEGPGKPTAPPYASFYLNGGQLMGPPALATRRAYLAWNVKPRDDRHVPPDHLALELGFMAHLADLAHADRTPRALAASAEFLREQILTWLPRFSAAVVASTTHPFFIGLANLTSALATSDDLGLRGILNVVPDTSTIPEGSR
jgi:TorA maturation chaperone TorD